MSKKESTENNDEKEGKDEVDDDVPRQSMSVDGKSESKNDKDPPSMSLPPLNEKKKKRRTFDFWLWQKKDTSEKKKAEEQPAEEKVDEEKEMKKNGGDDEDDWIVVEDAIPPLDEITKDEKQGGVESEKHTRKQSVNQNEKPEKVKKKRKKRKKKFTNRLRHVDEVDEDEYEEENIGGEDDSNESKKKKMKDVIITQDGKKLKLSDQYLLVEKFIQQSIESKILNLQGMKKLTYIPVGIIGNRELQYSVQTILVSRNSLQKVPKLITQFSSLFKLCMDHNQIDSIPMDMPDLTHLKILDLSWNKLTIDSFPDDFENFQILRYLNLSNNPTIGEIPLCVCHIPTLQRMDMSRCELSEIPKEIGNLISLQILCLKANRICELPETILRLGNLRELYLDRNPIQSIPYRLHIEMKELTTLTFSRNKFEGMPCLSNLDKLDVLVLDNNKISELPKKTFSPVNKSLSILNLCRNNIKRFPFCLRYIGKTLLQLDLRYNRITKFQTRVISTFVVLKRLLLEDNMIREIPHDFKLPELLELRLTRNRIENIHENAFVNMKKLKFLILDHNRLSSLPETMGGLEGLVRLSVKHNRLQSLPSSLSKCTNLAYIDLGFNEIREIPDSYRDFKLIKKLLLNNNRISNAPHMIARNKTLIYCDLRYNPFLRTFKTGRKSKKKKKGESVMEDVEQKTWDELVQSLEEEISQRNLEDILELRPSETFICKVQ